ncbi:26373_t:CDS:2 [Gigaspora margarita]|uniref:26373_t:CDS:1 n=1 Tax=Gigaspora margarita TaxID=4874 RepID=A0ABN7UHU8_GIGMA|nr:26373_t:CDS:2 [Gigaspora margarita]
MSDITQYEHAINYYYKKRYDLAVEILREIAKHGEKIEYKNLQLSNSISHCNEAKYCLAEYYFVRRGVKRDNNKSFELYLELSHSESDQQYSAKLIGTKSKKAFELFLKLSKSKSYEQNSEKYYLASCYENGGVTKDVNKACQLHLDLSNLNLIIKFIPFDDLSKSESDYQVYSFRWLANYYKNKTVHLTGNYDAYKAYERIWRTL